MTSWQTTIGQLSMVGGERQPRAANARAVEPALASRWERRKGNLYILVELQDKPPARQHLYRHLLNIIQRVYYESPSSVTAALQQAVGEAHGLLREAGVTGGVSCVVLRNDDIYIAQAGPALVILVHPDVVEQLPASTEGYEVPLGGSIRPEVGLFHTSAERTSTIVLAQSDWLSHVEPRTLAGAATAPTVAGVVDILQDLAGSVELSALVVGLSVPGEAPAGEEEVAWVEELEETPVYYGGVEREWKAPPAERKEPAPAVGELAREAGRGLVAATARLAEGAKTLGERMLPEAEPAPPRPRARPEARVEERPSRWPVLVAIAIPLLVLLAALVVWWQRGWEREKQFESLMQGARAALSTAVGLEDENLAREQLRDAAERVAEALLLKPGDPEATGVQQEIQAALDRVNHVVLLPMLMPLQEYMGLGRELSRVVVQGWDVFVLDRERDEVYQYRLDPELPDLAEPVGEGVLIRKGQQVGQVVVSELADIAWLTAEGYQTKSGLLVLDQSWRLFLSDVSGTWEPSQLPLKPPEAWQFPQSIETYLGNFYVLDPSQNQIFRYEPSGAGYEKSPSHYFAEDALINLGGVVDMAISSEPCGGYVYLLYANGLLTKYVRGTPEPFEPHGLDKRLGDTPALFVGPEECHVYVADVGNNRIVELDEDGAFLRQFRLAEGETLRNVRSLFVDEVGDVFYILTGDALYRTPIPQ